MILRVNFMHLFFPSPLKLQFKRLFKRCKLYSVNYAQHAENLTLYINRVKIMHTFFTLSGNATGIFAKPF